MNTLALMTPITNGFITNTVLKNLIDFCAPIIGIALVIFCVVQGVQIFRGSDGGSVKKLVTGVILLLFLLGIMYAAASFSTYGNAFKNVTDSIINQGASDAGSIVG